MNTVICPECGSANAEMTLNCSQCRINLKWPLHNLAGRSHVRQQQEMPSPAILEASTMEEGIGQGNMLYGALWCGRGIIITLGTYTMTAPNGGKYLIAWGAALFAAIQLFRGLFQSLR